MPEKQFIITTKTDAAAAAVEELLAELQDSISIEGAFEKKAAEVEEPFLLELQRRLDALHTGAEQTHSAQTVFEEAQARIDRRQQGA